MAFFIGVKAMEKIMYEVKVSIVGDQVCISQPNAFGNESGEDIISISVSQVPIICQWLRDAAQEIAGKA